MLNLLYHFVLDLLETGIFKPNRTKALCFLKQEFDAFVLTDIIKCLILLKDQRLYFRNSLVLEQD